MLNYTAAVSRARAGNSILPCGAGEGPPERAQEQGVVEGGPAPWGRTARSTAPLVEQIDYAARCRLTERISGLSQESEEGMRWDNPLPQLPPQL
jgi:hypothetical protein